MKVRTVEKLVEDLLAIAASMQNHPEKWDTESRIEAANLISLLFSVLECLS